MGKQLKKLKNSNKVAFCDCLAVFSKYDQTNLSVKFNFINKMIG